MVQRVQSSELGLTVLNMLTIVNIPSRVIHDHVLVQALDITFSRASRTTSTHCNLYHCRLKQHILSPRYYYEIKDIFCDVV